MTRIPPGDPIECPSARRLIDAYLFDELADADSERLALHVRGCVGCSALLGGSARVLGLLAALPVPEPTPHFDERVIVAAIADRRRRHEHRSWLADLRVQVLRGAMRTTGTLVATIVTVALLGGAFVFAVGGFIAQTAQNLPPGGTVGSEVTPTPAPTPVRTAAPTATPGTGNPTPAGVAVTQQPTTPPAPSPTPTASAEPTVAASPSPSPSPIVTPEPTPAPSATATPEPTPTPSPTDKPKRTPPPSASPSPTPSPAPTSAPLTSP